MNPKGIAGRVKPPVGLIPPVPLLYANQVFRFWAANERSCARVMPPVAILYASQAFRLGGRKFGSFNWQEFGKAVEGVTYYEAALRHMMSWFCGEWIDPESGAPHLGHANACCSIVLDVEPTGQLENNRPSCAQVAQIFPGAAALSGPTDLVGCYEDASWHLMCWFSGQNLCSWSALPHLAHVMAICAVVLEASRTGEMQENRPQLASAADLIVTMAEEKAGQRVEEAPYSEALDFAA